MSLTEFRSWVKYRAKRGSLNFGMRIEYGTAMLASIYANTHSQHGGYTVVDFMPHDSERPVTLEEAMKSW